MKLYFTAIFLLIQLLCYGQKSSDIMLLDTTSNSCKIALNLEYKEKFATVNKNIVYETNAQKNIIKDIYSEIQDGFIEKINNDHFICDNKVTSYLESLMLEVLASNGIDSKGYKILLSRNSEINAYNTGDGTVVINYGLFLSLSSEDELVFVISHEMGHQYLEHVKKDIESYARQSTSEDIIKKTKEIKSQKYGKAGKAFDLLKSMRYKSYKERRRKEIEADSIGLMFYINTKRNPKAAVSLLEKLDVSDVEKDSLTVNDYKAIFEKNGFIVKHRYFEKEESLFTKYDKEIRFDTDSLKSHPDCSTRIKLIKDYIDNNLNAVMKSSKTFENIKKNSVYQNLMNLYYGEQYGLSLYEALKLYKYNVNDMLLKNIIYINLVKIYESKNNYTINRYVPAHNNTGNTDSLNRFISFVNTVKISDLEILMNNFKF